MRLTHDSVAEEMRDLIWKVVCYLQSDDHHAGDYAVWEKIVLGGRHGILSVKDSIRSVCCDYATDKFALNALPQGGPLGASIDPWELISPLPNFIGRLAVQGWVFADGAPRIAAAISTCLLRYEGFRTVEGKSESEFRDLVVTIAQNSGDLSRFVSEFKMLMFEYWQFTKNPDIDAFAHVMEYRQLQGDNLDVALQLVDV